MGRFNRNERKERREGNYDYGFTIYEADLIGVGAFTEGELNRNPDKVPG